MKVEIDPAALSETQTNLYASGSFGTGLYSTIPSVLLLYFCTETLLIPAAVAGIIVFVPKLWAVFWDPIVGRWSDRSQHRWGRRRPFLLAGLIGMLVSFIALFSPPEMAWQIAAIWAALAYFALATLYSLYAVPYIALPAELGPTAEARAKLIGRRMVVVIIGVLAGAAGAPFLVDLGGGGREGYRLMALVTGVICLLAMSMPILMLKGRDRPAAVIAKGTPAGTSLLLAALRNAVFLRLVLSFLAQVIAYGALLSVLPYIVTKILGRPESDIASALAVLLALAIICVPLWTYLGRRTSERTLLVIALAGYAVTVTMLSICISAGVSWLWVLISLALVGVPFAALQFLPFTLVAHFIHESAETEEAALTGVWTASEKVGLAGGSTMTASAIALFGFSGSAIPIFLVITTVALCLSAAALLPSAPSTDLEMS
ncbi:MAG: MFS transporter [Blastomonas sp.]|uniref:MFS transporter n=1 Tax=Blastomonas sp. TaxID=1909299 RepID=UPI00258DB5EE|nr:MFS transporter [Blastomonas sp.]MCO5792543.1 MFS transporter [Blastomonas sp.]